MRLYIQENNELIKFSLPSKVDGSILFNYCPSISGRECSINVDSQDGKWVLKSNGSVNIINQGSYIDSCVLEDFQTIYLSIIGLQNFVVMYCLPSTFTDDVCYTTFNSKGITIGSDTSNNITYLHNLVTPKYAEILFKDNFAYLQSVESKTPSFIYINDKRVTAPTPLFVGDVIFICGLRIIWMNGFMRISMDHSKYVINGIMLYSDPRGEVSNSNFTAVSEYDSGVPLYSSDQYFFHTPRIRSIPTAFDLKIDGPPGGPPPQESEMPFLLSIGSSFTMLGMMFTYSYNLYSGLSSGEKDLSDYVIQIVMIITMVFGSMVFPFFIKKWTKKSIKRKEARRKKKYRDYLAEKAKALDVEKVKQEQIFTEGFQDPNSTLNVILNRTRKLWNREIVDEDFLEIRMGVGDRESLITISAPEESFTLEDDVLLDEVIALKGKYDKLQNVPITTNFKKELVTALILNNTKKMEFINGVMLQLLAYHSPGDLKIVVVTNEKNSHRWDYLRYVPHCWSDDNQFRFFANNLDDIKSVCQFLDSEYLHRKEIITEKTKNSDELFKEKRKEADLFDTFYLIVTDDFKSMRNFKFTTDFLDSEFSYGFSMILFEEDLKNMPKECKKFIVTGDTDSGMFTNNVSDEQVTKFFADYPENINMRDVCVKIGSIPVLRKDADSQLPSALSFLQMYNVGKIEQLNIRNRWLMSDPMSSLAAPIGVHTNGDLFYLNLHEKYDGPHGLIAGSTGSGKSEFIISYILSMALNYDPREVQFVLIDYKGGGLAGAFENREMNIAIPHLAGTITNLDVAEMNRTLVSIQSELHRRQAQFNKVKEEIGESTMDIYKYQKLYREGVIKEPVSHLFIISDEFAELKAQQPDFMNQLVSTARIGRSLGVHLILATQKPSGVVNDQIWSNSKFKVCLKVQTKADSMEMLKRPEAASIKETGRFYLQVGYDEYFDIGQSAWSGEKYVPVEHIVKKIDNSINFVGNTGNVLKSATDVLKADKNAVDYGDQLTNIVKYLCKISREDGYIPKKLWLPSLGNVLMLNDVLKKYSSKMVNEGLVAYVGEYDAPSKQEQGMFSVDLLKGNILVYGQPSSGKENLITTIIHGLSWYHSPEEVNFYIGDFGAETLKMLSKYPHVGDVFLTDDSQRLMNLLKMLDKELERRKKDYSEFGGNYIEYCKLSGKKDRAIIIALNNYENFLENYSKMSEVFIPLFRDGYKYGIIFIVTTALSSAVRSRVAQNFVTKICMKMPNDTDYRDLLGSPKGMVPVDNFGRGIFTIDGGEAFEFQTADICARDMKTQYIREIGATLEKKYPNKKAAPIPVLPNIAYVEDYVFDLKGLSCVPIGVEINSLETYVYDFTENRINLISAKTIKNHIYFMYALLKQMLSLSKVKVHIIDALSIYRGKYDNIDLCTENFEDGFVKMYNSIMNDGKQTDTHVFFIVGISSFVSSVYEKYRDKIDSCFKAAKDCKNNVLIFLDDSNSYKLIQTEEWYRENINNTFGIWLGEDVSSQIALGIMSLGVEEKKIMFPCIGYPVYQGNHMIIKYLVDGVDRKDEQ